MSQQQIELGRLAKPLQEWLRDNYGPDTEVLITKNQASLEQPRIAISSSTKTEPIPFNETKKNVRRLVFIRPADENQKRSSTRVLIVSDENEQGEEYTLDVNDLGELCKIFKLNGPIELEHLTYRPFFLTTRSDGGWIKVEGLFNSKKGG